MIPAPPGDRRPGRRQAREAAPLAFTTGTRPERWFVAPLLFVALAGLGVIAAEGVYLAASGPVSLG